MTSLEGDDERNSRTSFFSLKNGLIALWTLSAVFVLVFVLLFMKNMRSSTLQNSRNESCTLDEQPFNDDHSSFMDSDSMIHPMSDFTESDIDVSDSHVDSTSPTLIVFTDYQKIFVFDPTEEQLEIKVIFAAEQSRNIFIENFFQLSRDKKNVYCNIGYEIKSINIETLEVEDVNLEGLGGYQFALKKPELNSGFYYSRLLLSNQNGQTKIRHVDLTTFNAITEYSHRCGFDSITILDQFSDGSRLLYKCLNPATERIYMKNLEDPASIDEDLFDLSPGEKLLLSPDNSKAIVYGRPDCYCWKIFDLLNPHLQGRRVNFQYKLGDMVSYTFSNDKKTLYAVVENLAGQNHFSLYKVDIEGLFDKVARGETNIELERGIPVSI